MFLHGQRKGIHPLSSLLLDRLSRSPLHSQHFLIFAIILCHGIYEMNTHTYHSSLCVFFLHIDADDTREPLLSLVKRQSRDHGLLLSLSGRGSQDHLHCSCSCCCFCIFKGDSWQKSFQHEQQLLQIKPKMTPNFIAQLQILKDILAAFDYSGSKDTSLMCYDVLWLSSLCLPTSLLASSSSLKQFRLGVFLRLSHCCPSCN